MTEFSAEQQEAIAIDRLGQDACIVAGPGSGKTTVLVERFRQLVAEAGISPSRILAITFTEKAASNMRDKLAAELNAALDTANVSTVHGFCFRLIREHAIEAGVDPGAVILEEGRGVLLRQRLLETALDQLLAEEPEAARGLIGSLCGSARSLTDAYDAIRSAGKSVADLRRYVTPPPGNHSAEIARLAREIHALPLTPAQRAKVPPLLEWNTRVQTCSEGAELRRLLRVPVMNLQGAKEDLKQRVGQIRDLQRDLLTDCVTAMHERDRGALISVLERFDALYAAEKRTRGLLDFSDLEFYAVRLLETHPHIRQKLRSHFQQIMMDEFQDTNLQQEKLLSLLRGPDTFYAVGDINQSIFGFRYSSPDVFRAYRDQVRSTHKHYVDLVENWRSRPEILLAVETLLQNRPGVEPRQLVAARQRPAKRMPSVEVIAVEQPDPENGAQWEAEWVAQRILELYGTLRFTHLDGNVISQRKARFRDMAVLVRNSSVFEEFARAFEQRNIPFEQSRRRGFLDSREALDLTHLLRTVANPRDELSLAVVLRSPVVQLSDESLLRLEQIAGNLGDALHLLRQDQEVQFEELDRQRLREFRASLAGWRAAAPHIPVQQLLLRAIDEAGYPYLPGTAAGDTIDKFLDMASGFTGTLQEFIEELELLREVDPGEPDAPVETAREAVRMMTVHSAKGLEFPIVFVASLNKGVRSSAPPFSFTPEVGLGAKWRVSGDEEGQSDAFHAANLQVIEEREKEEGNRLLYVAMTRAEEHLVLSYHFQQSHSNWATPVKDHIVKPFPVPFEKPTDVTVAHANGRTFSVRLLRTALPPAQSQSSFQFEPSSAAAALPRPALTGQYDSSVTVTALATFADCPRRYYLAHAIGWEQRHRTRLAERGDDFEEPELPANELGRAVHRLLAGEALPAPSALAQELAFTFQSHPLGHRSRQSARVEREWGFLNAVGDVVISGQVDLWFVENDSVVLVDYKTNDLTAAEAPAAAAAYHAQLHLYALTIERATGLTVREAYLHFLRPDVAAPVHPDPAAAIRLVETFTAAQEAGDYPLHVAKRCGSCPFFKNLCPAELPGVLLQPNQPEQPPLEATL